MKNKRPVSLIMKLAIAIIGCIILYFGITYNYAIDKSENKDTDYQVISLKSDNYKYDIDLKFTKGKTFKYPIFAVWLEDSVGNYIETLYISKSIAGSIFQHAKYVNNKWSAGIIRRPEALPCWSHRRNIKAEDGFYIPLHPASDLDAVTGATPQNNFIIKTGSSFEKLKKFRILLELNQSYDWNDFYSKNSFPNDSIYSGPGLVGQPSLVYSIDIDKGLLKKENNFPLKVIGHGHHSGKNGTIYTNLDSITTALSIADQITVSINSKD